MGISWIQILVVAVLVLLLFGRGRISSLMGDIGAGITSFRKGISEGQTLDDDESDASESKTIEGEATASPADNEAASQSSAASQDTKN
ncbi:MAG: twin-arginine translocase TatA/TatE family subunit [Parvibaculales bacterium]